MSTPLGPTLLTGSPRSGTTLLTRLLGEVDGIAAFSQPLPLVLVGLKAEFLRARGADAAQVAYPLADEQFEHAYPADALVDFLRGRRISRDDIRSWFAAMADYSGQYHRPVAAHDLLRRWDGAGDLLSLVSAYAAAHGAGERAVVWKETFAEEFATYVLERGGRVILIVRDLRDMVVSHVAGGASAHAGRPRPLLFLARQWRRTVAHALALADRPDVAVLRFEDLLTSPTRTVTDLLGRLLPHVAPPSSVALDQPANSSFTRDHAASPVGRHVDHLAAADRRFLEALCHPEMLAMGYTPTIDAGEVTAALQGGAGTDHLQRPELAHYRYDERRRAEEFERRASLLEGRWTPAAFIHPAAFTALRKVVA